MVEARSKLKEQRSTAYCCTRLFVIRREAHECQTRVEILRLVWIRQSQAILFILSLYQSDLLIAKAISSLLGVHQHLGARECELHRRAELHRPHRRCVWLLDGKVHELRINSECHFNTVGRPLDLDPPLQRASEGSDFLFEVRQVLCLQLVLLLCLLAERVTLQWEQLCMHVHQTHPQHLKLARWF